MILADLLAQLINALIGALIQAGRNVQWRRTARLRPVRPVWVRLGRRLGLVRCSTCRQRWTAPPCCRSLDGRGSHTAGGGRGAA